MNLAEVESSVKSLRRIKSLKQFDEAGVDSPTAAYWTLGPAVRADVLGSKYIVEVSARFLSNEWTVLSAQLKLTDISNGYF